MRLILLLLGLACIYPHPAKAETCLWEDGGYCVSTLARETLRVIREATKTESAREEIASKLILPEGEGGATSQDPLSGGVPYFNFYDSLWSSGLLQDKQTAFNEASAVGGTKIGGVNLVVLGARTLQRMVDLGWLNLDQAQAVLELSRELSREQSRRR